MNILIAFGSTEGHTKKIAYHINGLLEDRSHASVMFDCGSVGEKPDPGAFDAIMIAGSIHQEKHQESVLDFVKQNLRVLKTKPSAFISVSLSASIKEAKDEAEKYVDDFIKDTKWKPDNIHMAGGAIRFLEYDFFKRFTVQYMVLKGKKMPDKSTGNPEYTDWKALDDFTDRFLASLQHV